MKTRITCIVFFLFLVGLSAEAATEGLLNITGAVNQPLSLTLKDLVKLQQSVVRINDIRENGRFNGVFTCSGVPLKTLLEMSHIEKKNTDFKKQIDLAVVVKNSTGEQVILSWGEIFYKNPGHIILAVSAAPIFPHKGIDHFADETAYRHMINILNRKIAFPKLVIEGDLYSDRSLESVSEIRVVDVKPKVEGKKSPTVYSENFRIVQSGKPDQVFTQLPEGCVESIPLHIVGEGRGYHGSRRAGGVPFKTLMEPYKKSFDLNTVFVVSAPDAYRSLISYGELFINPHGDRILIADTFDGRPIQKDGRFILVLPDDLMADREVKAVGKIEIMNLDALK